MVELTQEQQVLRGESAAGILSHGPFMGFLREFQQDILECIGNTAPDQHKERTTLYYQHRGLSDLLERLVAYRDTATRIIEAEHPELDFTDEHTDETDTD